MISLKNNNICYCLRHKHLSEYLYFWTVLKKKILNTFLVHVWQVVCGNKMSPSISVIVTTREQRLIEGSLYTSEDLLLFFTVNMVTDFFLLCCPYLCYHLSLDASFLLLLRSAFYSQTQWFYRFFLKTINGQVVQLGKQSQYLKRKSIKLHLDVCILWESKTWNGSVQVVSEDTFYHLGL